MIRRLLILLVAASVLAGCTAHGGYRHYAVADHGDYYYAPTIASTGYSVGHYAGPGVHIVHGAPYYLQYPYYYSLFWGIDRHYYSPWYRPHFRYGVTGFPSDWFSFSFVYHSAPRGWWPYAPYRYSAWDHHFISWHYWQPRHRHMRPPRFGHPANEAQWYQHRARMAERGWRGDDRRRHAQGHGRGDDGRWGDWRGRGGDDRRAEWRGRGDDDGRRGEWRGRGGDDEQRAAWRERGGDERRAEWRGRGDGDGARDGRRGGRDASAQVDPPPNFGADAIQPLQHGAPTLHAAPMPVEDGTSRWNSERGAATRGQAARAGDAGMRARVIEAGRPTPAIHTQPIRTQPLPQTRMHDARERGAVPRPLPRPEGVRPGQRPPTGLPPARGSGTIDAPRGSGAAAGIERPATVPRRSGPAHNTGIVMPQPAPSAPVVAPAPARAPSAAPQPAIAPATAPAPRAGQREHRGNRDAAPSPQRSSRGGARGRWQQER